MMSFFSKNKIIGLDIGSTSIKIAELDVGKKNSTLVSFGILPTPPQAIVSGDITNPQAIALAIRELIKHVNTNRKNVAAGLGGASVIVKRISIPRMEEKLISEQIRWEAEQYIPYDINEVNLDYEILKTRDPQSETMDLLLIAAVQNHAYKYVEAISLAGLNCPIMDVSGFALINCFKANYGDMKGQTIAVLNIGAGSTTVAILENSEAVFCRDIPIGGINYTMDLQKNLNVSYEEAESIKVSLGKSKNSPAEATKSIELTHEIMADEIKASFDFYMNSSQAQNITRCFVTGGGARVLGLMDRLSKIVPCEKLDPFFNIKVNNKSFTKEYLNQIRDFSAVAIGLGLRKLGEE
ncbi:MAG: type IV pilus assembly protein PilM [Bdellovibrionales bacterium]